MNFYKLTDIETGEELYVNSNSINFYMYTNDGELIKVWPSTMEVGRQTGFSQGYISLAANGKHKQAYGFIWKYI